MSSNSSNEIDDLFSSTEDRYRAMAEARVERDKSSSVSDNFSSNLWVSNANNELAAIDVYSKPKTKIVSAAETKQTSLIDDIANKLDPRKLPSLNGTVTNAALLRDMKTSYSSRQSRLKASSTTAIGELIGKGITNAQTGLKKATAAYSSIERMRKAATSTGSVSSRISGLNRGLGGVLSALGTPLDKDTQGLLNDINKTSVTIGNTTRRVPSSKTSKGEIDLIIKGLEALTGTSGVMRSVDSGAKLFSGIGLVNAGAKHGTSGVSKIVINSLGSEYAHKVAKGSLNSVAKSSNIDALRDLSESVDKGLLKKINPNVLKIYASSFTYSDDYTLEEKQDLYKRTIETFDHVDPHWRGDDDAVDLSLVIGSSRDFKDLFSLGCLTTSAGDKLLGFGCLFRKTDVVTELKRTFPRTVITPNTVKRTVK